jgi:transcription elongation GreA/GreB family factor
VATVAIGSKVELQFGDLREEWIIVDPSEADAANHRMSAVSALGLALVGRKTGDYCAVQAPGGMYGVTILNVDGSCESSSL